ncbi:MAG: MFS transporter, partial [Bacillus sp. (in: firmicutes)]
TPMMLGSVAGSSVGGIFLTKTSYRNLMIVSIISYVLGMYFLGTLTVDTARSLLTIYMILVGFGVGFSFSLLPTASMHNLEPQYRGTANSTNSFLRSFGMTLGVTVYGTLQNNLFTDKLTEAFKGIQGAGDFKMGDPRQIFQASERSKIPDFILDKIVHAMSDSISHTFLLTLIPIAIAAITIFFMGNARVEVSKKPAKS